MASEETENLHQAAQLIHEAESLIICAGAGMGVDSGMPDFRSEEGFWGAYPLLGQERMGFKDIAQPYSFEKSPRLVWGFYGHRLKMYRDLVPHEGFRILRNWAAEKSDNYWIFTSNVDGHFQKAGFSPNLIEECHGSIHYLQCTINCSERIWSSDVIESVVDSSQGLWAGDLPSCTLCGALLRPNILMFNDWRWNHMRKNYQLNNRKNWIDKNKKEKTKPIIIELGAGTSVPSVRYFSAKTCQDFADRGAVMIRINPHEASVGEMKGVGIEMGAMKALAIIDEILRKNNVYFF